MSSPSFFSFKEQFACNDDGFFTYTSTEQKRVEDTVNDTLKAFLETRVNLETSEESPEDAENEPMLIRRRHSMYLLISLQEVNIGYMSLDASRTWMCFWAINALNLLKTAIPHPQKMATIAFIKACEHADGGYGGGPGQYAHLATTYAAVMALSSLQLEEALESIDRKTLHGFLNRMKQADGSFTMHDGGESDIRGAYCALAVSSLCQIPLDTNDTDKWVASCQTYEGGFGGEPGTEAHGGYAYCGLAASVLLGSTSLINIPAYLKWLTWRQMRFEGGFQGRTNKLVDGCYSFWQAAAFPLLDNELKKQKNGVVPGFEGLFSSRQLEEYILIACQDPRGGLRDKPEKGRDLYHTSYVLAGLSVAQGYSMLTEEGILGSEKNLLEPINALYNVTTISEEFTASYFSRNPFN